MNDSEQYLTTRELAALLRIKERKVYELASTGEVPCTKVTGKLLFPRAAIDAWLSASQRGLATGTPERRAVFQGSHDPLLEWALRESLCDLPQQFGGSGDGLERFGAGDAVATGLHLYDATTNSWNVARVQNMAEQQPDGRDFNAVLIGFAQRSRGLVSQPDTPVASFEALTGHRLVQRQSASGVEPLLASLLESDGIDASSLNRVGPIRNETDAALAIVQGDADVAFGLEAIADQFKLAFTPIVTERFDILVDRKAYFDAPFQSFLKFCSSEAFREKAARFRGYDFSELGVVRWNGEQ